jgi:hypothetical protein
MAKPPVRKTRQERELSLKYNGNLTGRTDQWKRFSPALRFVCEHLPAHTSPSSRASNLQKGSAAIQHYGDPIIRPRGKLG